MTSPYGNHLPIFPCLDYQPITEDRIERAVERLFNRADTCLMTGSATQEQYDAWAKVLNAWTEEQYAKLRLASAGPDLVCNETAYGSTVRLSFAIKVF